jgi:outer membrane protein assembly factor BamD
MSTTRRRHILTLLLLGTSAVFSMVASSCSTTEVSESDPAAMMKDIEDDIESSRYILALEKLQKVKNQHPYSRQAVDAKLRIADVYFLQENFAEAAASYEAFRDLHPKHPKLPYAAYRVGLSYFSDLPSLPARDLSAGYRAEEAFKEFLLRYPADENAPAAREKLVETNRILAEKEMYIGNFYFKREMWEAAKGRYSKVVNLYANTPFVELAKTRLKEIEEKPAEKTE